MGRHILIIEDDRDIRKGLQLVLESEGYTVEQAENGQVALELLKASDELPSLIILDLMMPIMDGFQFRERQAQDLRIQDIPVIIMTADGHIEEKKFRTGAQLALRKPADVDAILSAVNIYAKATG